MCMNDWRVGRLIRHKSTEVETDDVDTFTVRPDRDRVAIMIGLTGELLPVTALTGAFNPQIEVFNGSDYVLELHAFRSDVMFSLVTHGELPTLQFNFALVNGAVGLSIIEWFLPEDVLVKGANEFMGVR